MGFYYLLTVAWIVWLTNMGLFIESKFYLLDYARKVAFNVGIITQRV
ncbi:hypothetical protein GV51_0833 [Gardnerella vaginalis 5-1]|nr:hypothetical protein GV51_0833 [Gardnerella vaginalis 5-1]